LARTTAARRHPSEQAFAGPFVLHRADRQDLQGDRAPEANVERPVDLTHAALSDQLLGDVALEQRTASGP
jgi:hypothetical protein